MTWRPMEAGLIWSLTAGAGNRRLWPSTVRGGLIVTLGIGFTAIADGTGLPIIHGVGLRSIMDAGSCTTDAVGFGCPIEPRGPPG